MGGHKSVVLSCVFSYCLGVGLLDVTSMFSRCTSDILFASHAGTLRTQVLLYVELSFFSLLCVLQLVLCTSYVVSKLTLPESAEGGGARLLIGFFRVANGTLQPAVLFGRLRHNMISVFVFFGGGFGVVGWA